MLKETLKMSGTVGVQGCRAGPLHLPHLADRADPYRSCVQSKVAFVTASTGRCRRQLPPRPHHRPELALRSVMPGRFDEQPTHVGVDGLSDRSRVEPDANSEVPTGGTNELIVLPVNRSAASSRHPRGVVWIARGPVRRSVPRRAECELMQHRLADDHYSRLAERADDIGIGLGVVRAERGRRPAGGG